MPLRATEPEQDLQLNLSAMNLELKPFIKMPPRALPTVVALVVLAGCLSEGAAQGASGQELGRPGAAPALAEQLPSATPASSPGGSAMRPAALPFSIERGELPDAPPREEVAAAGPATTQPLGRSLPGPGRRSAKASAPDKRSSSGAVVTAIGSLAVVIGVFLVVAWIARRSLPNKNQPLPAEVVRALGHSPLVKGQQMQLIQLGNKLVLVASNPSAVTPLAEVTDGAEVERLVGLCQAEQPDSISATFRQVLSQMGREGKKKAKPSKRANQAELGSRPESSTWEGIRA